VTNATLDPTIPRRWRIDDHGSEFVISIPRKLGWLAIVLELLAVAYFAYEFRRLPETYSGFGTWLGPAISSLVIIGFMKDFLWSLGGLEIITIKDEQFILRREVFGIGWSRTFDSKKVGGLHFQKAGNNVKSGVAFEYDSALITKGRRFGDDLTEEEADELIAIIIQRFPGLDRAAPQTRHFLTLSI
jgi:hypothetical protein